MYGLSGPWVGMRGVFSNIAALSFVRSDPTAGCLQVLDAGLNLNTFEHTTESPEKPGRTSPPNQHMPAWLIKSWYVTGVYFNAIF